MTMRIPLLLLLYCCCCSRRAGALSIQQGPIASSTSLTDTDDPLAVGGSDPGRAQSCTPVDIEVPMCQGISYASTASRLPSGFNKQSDVAVVLKQFDELVQVPCAPFLRLFVCSMHLPFCNREQRLLVRPCREFCLRIRDLCSPVLQHYGYSWPVSLACDHLPPEAGSGSSTNLCLRPRADEFEERLRNMTHLQPPPLQPRRPPQQPPTPGGRNSSGDISASSSSSSSPASSAGTAASRRCSAAEVRLGTEPNSSCAPRCHASLLFFAEDKQFAAAWMLVWSVLCLICTGLAVATFLLDGDRFRFPERPIVWVAVCYSLYSTAHILRAAVGPQLACSSQQLDGSDPYRVSRHAGQWCAALFLLLYFSWLAGLLWWLALTVCWYLCAVKKWAHEALAAKAVWLHLLAWGVPLLLSVLLLVLHRIEADELTHLCVVDGSRPGNLLAFVILPSAAALLLGLCLLTRALCSSVTVRDSLKWSGNVSFRRLEKLMTKIGLFSFLFVLPTTCVLAANVYELVERGRWTDSLARVLARPQCVGAAGIRHGEPACTPEHRPSSALYMLKIFMSLAAGLPSGLVVWVNAKSARAWRRCLCRLTPRGSKRPSSSAAGKRGPGSNQQTYTTIDSVNCATLPAAGAGALGDAATERRLRGGGGLAAAASAASTSRV